MFGPYTPQVKTWALSPLRYESGKAERCICDPFGVLLEASDANNYFLFLRLLINGEVVEGG